MPTTPAPSPRRRRLLTALVVTVSVVAVPLATGSPAGAVNAPLTTTDGIGIRIDENAILGVVLDDLETAMDPIVEQWVYDGALTHTGIANPDWVTADLDIDLAVDFVNAGTTGFPQGGLRLAAVIDDLLIRTYVYGPSWWQPDCLLHLETDDPLTVTASARVDTTALPAAPFTALPTTNDWPSTTSYEFVAPGYPWSCTSHLTTLFNWTGFSDLADPTSPASLFQAEMETRLAALLDQLWVDNVEPLVDSLATLAGFGVSYNQIRTDTNALVATADVNATAGVTVDGSGPYPVTGAQDAGVTSNVNTLLAQRSLGGVPTDVIVTLHPNVTNQYLAAVHDHVNGSYSWTPTSSAIATDLVDPGLGTCYWPTHWWTYLEAQAVPYLTPTGPGGTPRMQLPQTTVQFSNPGCNPVDPRVATFTGALSNITVTSTGTPLGPRGSAPTASWTAARTQADTATAARTPAATAATLLPWARDVLGPFLDSVPGHVEMTPGAFPGRAATLCTTCGRFTGDQRITEGFQIT